MKKINIGLDIGITSVGYSIIDEDNQILKMGVRLFNDPANSKDGKLDNEKRRESRSQRRRISRTKNRKDDFIKLLIKHKWYDDKNQIKDILNYDITKWNVETPIHLKVKALKEKVDKNILTIVLFHYLKHRGFFHVTEEMLKEEGILNSNQNNQLFTSEKILSFYNEKGFYKNSEITKNIPNLYLTEEIHHLLKVQKTPIEFQKEYLSIFNRKREFSEGPGSEKSPTPYGLWRLENGKTNKIGDNLWDVTIGTCTYCEEKRGGKNSPIAELFNLLNDLSNTSFDNNKKNKLSASEKVELLNMIPASWNKKTSFNVKLSDLAKLKTEKDLEKVQGYRIDKNGKPEITKTENFSKIGKWLLENKLLTNFNFNNWDHIFKINNVFETLRKNSSDALKRIDAIKELFPELSEDSIQDLVKKISGLSDTHSLCYKDMKDFIEHSLKDSEDHNDNQMAFFYKTKAQSEYSNLFKNKKYIPNNIFETEEFKDKAIMSPTAKRATVQSINIINAIIKEFKNHQINNITIEMARDKNSKQERENINKIQKNNEEFLKQLENKHNFNFNNEGLSRASHSKNLKMKLKLWLEQNEKDLYSGQKILLDDLVKNPNKFNIDHIIPYSISFMDGRVNKVLTTNELNSQKGNKTPYQWLSPKGKFEEFEERINKHFYLIDKKNTKKRDLLLFKGDPSQDLGSFIERNLVDTRYSTKLVLEIFSNFFKENKTTYPETKIKTINGYQTNFARYNLFHMPKDRDDYSHHAIDATIANFLGNSHEFNLLTKYKIEDNIISIKWVNGEKQFVNMKTGEVLSENSEEIKQHENQIISDLKTQIEYLKKEQNILFSRKIVSRNNIPLSNETIYGIKWHDSEKQEGNLVNKIDLLKDKDVSKYFDDNAKDREKNASKLMCFNEDPYLYQLLYKIYNQFKDETKTNPFIIYMNHKYNIKNPIIVEIKDENDNEFRVKKLKKLGSKKSNNNIIVLDQHNSNAVMDTLGWTEIRIYKDDNGKFITFPINQKTLLFKNKKMIPDENKISNLLKEKNISNPKFLLLKEGSIFMNKENKKLFYCNGGNFNDNIIELKTLFHSNTYQNYFPRDQMNISFSTISKEYDVCQTDVLGNVYNKKNIEDFFK